MRKRGNLTKGLALAIAVLTGAMTVSAESISFEEPLMEEACMEGEADLADELIREQDTAESEAEDLCIASEDEEYGEEILVIEAGEDEPENAADEAEDTAEDTAEDAIIEEEDSAVYAADESGKRDISLCEVYFDIDGASNSYDMIWESWLKENSVADYFELSDNDSSYWRMDYGIDYIMAGYCTKSEYEEKKKANQLEQLSLTSGEPETAGAYYIGFDGIGNYTGRIYAYLCIVSREQLSCYSLWCDKVWIGEADIADSLYVLPYIDGSGDDMDGDSHGLVCGKNYKIGGYCTKEEYEKAVLEGSLDTLTWNSTLPQVRGEYYAKLCGIDWLKGEGYVRFELADPMCIADANRYCGYLWAGEETVYDNMTMSASGSRLDKKYYEVTGYCTADAYESANKEITAVQWDQDQPEIEGEYYARVAARSPYTGTTAVFFQIRDTKKLEEYKYDTELTVWSGEEQVSDKIRIYRETNGKEVVLTYGSDFVITEYRKAYEGEWSTAEPTDPGVEYEAKIQGTGVYTGVIEVSFRIEDPKEISSYDWEGKTKIEGTESFADSLKIFRTVKGKDIVLNRGTDYEIAGYCTDEEYWDTEDQNTIPWKSQEPTEVGFFFVKVCSKGGYTGEKIVWFRRETATAVPTHVHSYAGYVVTKPATVLETGTMTAKCSCGSTDTRVISKLAPTGSVNAAGNIPMKTGQKTKVIEVTDLAAGDYIASVSSSNTKVAAVTANNGTLTIKAKKKTGKTTITIKMASGLTKTFNIKVGSTAVKTKSIRVASKKVSLKAKQTFDLKAVRNPITSTDGIQYSTSNKKVAVVSRKGVVTAKGKGKAVITITSGKAKVKVTVTVK